MRTLKMGADTEVHVLDEPGQGNANHHYRISGFTTKPPSRVDFPAAKQPDRTADVIFQNGPIKEVGVNRVTNEDLLAIVIDRMRGFQSGDYACNDNYMALTKLEESLMWLRNRTNEREARGVEGTHAK